MNVTPSKIRRPVVKIESSAQIRLFEAPAEAVSLQERSPGPQPIRFHDPDPNELRLGELPLREHLRQMGVKDALLVREILDEQDFSAFLARYQPMGRRPYAPRAMVGLILYGLMRGISSLRDLERFSRVDLSCMWVSGGIAPDHSVLGRFVHRHAEELSEGLFEGLLESVLRRTKSGRTQLAGDATVIEAVSSRFGLLKREAIEEGGTEQERAEREELKRVLEERRAESGGRGHELGHPAEPDASVLKQKGGSFSRLSYVPAILANADRVVVDAELDGQHELKPIAKLIGRQHFETLSLDNGFLAEEILEAAIEKDRDILVAVKRPGPRAGQYFGDHRFVYDEERDAYRCPAEQWLTRVRQGRSGQQRKAYTEYQTKACVTCPLHGECTKHKYRTIQRSRATELREGMMRVMSQRPARRRYAKHQAWVEPVFSALRSRQGLNRFRRRGLAKARLEFRLHVMAYNLSRAWAAVTASLGLLNGFAGRLKKAPGGRWTKILVSGHPASTALRRAFGPPQRQPGYALAA